MSNDRDNTEISRACARMTRPEMAGFALVLMLALVLRLIKLDESLWLDEIITCQHAGRSLIDVGHIMYPLYYLVIHFLLPLSSNEIFLRMPSVVAGMLGVVAVYFAARSLQGRFAGLVAALFLATAPFHIDHSQEIRFYSTLALAGLLAAWTLHEAVTNGGPWRWLAYFASVCFGLASHVLFAPFWAAMFIGVFIWALLSRELGSRGARLRVLATLVLSGVIITAAFFSLWTLQGKSPLRVIGKEPVAKRQVSTPVTVDAPKAPHSETPAKPAKPRWTPLTPAQYIGFYGEFYGRKSLSVTAFLGCLAAVGLAWLLWRRTPMAAIVMPPLFLLPVPLFIMSARHFYHARYFIILLPFSAILIAIGLSVLARFCAGLVTPKTDEGARGRFLLSAVMAILLLALAPSTAQSLREYYASTPGWRWKALIADTVDSLRPNDVIVYVRPDQYAWTTDWPCDHYLRRYLRNAVLLPIQPKTAQTPEDLIRIARANPQSALYIVSTEYEPVVGDTMGPDFAPILRALSAETRAYQRAVLHTVPAPTTNLINDGGFEDAIEPHQSAVTVTSGGAPVRVDALASIRSTEAYSGRYSARLSTDIPQGPEHANLLFSVGALTPGCRYTFSARIKHRNTLTLKDPFLVADVVLTWLDDAGTRQWKTLSRIEDTGDWHLVAVAFTHGQDTPPDADVQVGFAMNNSAGTLWADNTQLEAAPFPSPFVNGTKPSHDQALSSFSVADQGRPESCN